VDHSPHPGGLRLLHDNVNFATGLNHAGGLPEIDDNQCAECHIPQGELPFDASIIGAHTIPTFAPGLPGVVFTLQKVDNGSAGQAPTVTFTLNDASGNAILPSGMNSLNLVMAGPTADYASVVSESALKASGSGGTYMYTFKNSIPATATGTYTVGIEGYRNITLLPGTVTQQVVRDAGHNVVISFSVDGSNLAPHPVEAQTQNCNACHYSSRRTADSATRSSTASSATTPTRPTRLCGPPPRCPRRPSTFRS